ncbi:iron-containing alcohol dehydrogenase [Geobacillus thermodenitrificans]|jgi:alcohol dehydrogenase class IV|uniref:iron-containing alcohol dehydrogenase n=1 Tax=Geobacillus thermodenitrificans TaxID=33940 RepID=UPI000C290D95|nr:iron-containing alcohol dehydrogenase [Geobacillus thermodenitrificans]MEC5186913.1 1,3-propanediol dehydrogenase [Geobacillus thermodenitrificans]MED0661990.1 alcohol dehydrogenase [Geobacillus thermodenitrificans]MED3717254.1 iron-containing alcohol dehydrogenase [Geobacillus thermodenitrificans]PJW20988.1 alcohol dehydrogenase [Geobacillus thermodenitrificans]
MYELLVPNRVIYGRDTFREVGRQAKTLGTKALIVSDPVMENIGLVARCEQYLREAGLPLATYTRVDTEPTDVHVKEALDVCRSEQCDVIVAIGGGSSIDAAKAVAVMMTNEGTISDYVGNAKMFTKKPVPLIAIPTTAGTGSEVTKVTVIIDTKTDVKMMISQPALLPAVAIVDPLLTVSCPPSVTAATGVDALCHSIEAYISRRAHPVTDVLALSAIEAIIGHLRRAYENGQDIEAREKMAIAAMKAGMAFSNASVTLVHGMSRPIGALFHVPHGVSNAMLLPGVLEFTKESATERLAVIARLINPQLKDVSDAEAADALVEEVKQLCRDLHIPNMKTWGIDKAAFDKAVDKMAADALASGSPSNNPRVPTHEEIVALYHICYDYRYDTNTVSH